MPTKEERIEQSEKIVQFLITKCDEMPVEQSIRFVYNNAIDDVAEAIDTYIRENQMWRTPFLALKSEIKNWMPLISEEDVK